MQSNETPCWKAQLYIPTEQTMYILKKNTDVNYKFRCWRKILTIRFTQGIMPHEKIHSGNDTHYISS